MNATTEAKWFLSVGFAPKQRQIVMIVLVSKNVGKYECKTTDLKTGKLLSHFGFGRDIRMFEGMCFKGTVRNKKNLQIISI